MPVAPVLRQYAKAHDRFCELEQAEVQRNHPYIAEGARWHSRIIIRAWLAERDDPELEP
jgi:hypothetical protein